MALNSATETALIRFEDYFMISSGIFRCLGLNPYFECKEPVGLMRQRLDTVLFHVCFWFLLITTSLEFIFVITVAGDRDKLMDFCRALSCALFDLMGIEEMLLMWWEGFKFNDFILQLEDMFPMDAETQKKYNIALHAEDTKLLMKNLRNIFVICIFIWVVGSPCYDVFMSYALDVPYVFELPFKIWSPVALDTPVTFNVALFMEFDTIYASVMIILAVNTFFVSIVSQISLQFDMLSQNIRDLPPNDEKGIIKLIVSHIRLIEISQQFAQLLSRTVFLNHILSSMALCLGLFECVTSDTSEIFRFIVYLLCVLVQTFNMSFIGDKLIQDSSKISHAVYETNWLDNNKVMRLRLVQIMLRSQKPLLVTGMGFFTISLPSFTKILTTSFSYFTLLWSMMNSSSGKSDRLHRL